MKRALLKAISFSQEQISAYRPRRCRYYPTCSAYAAGAVEQHGAGKGFLLAVWRLLRCWPWSPGGVDLVPLPGRWRSTEEQNRTLPDGTKIDL